jgi:hypothetical protein
VPNIKLVGTIPFTDDLCRGGFDFQDSQQNLIVQLLSAREDGDERSILYVLHWD